MNTKSHEPLQAIAHLYITPECLGDAIGSQTVRYIEELGDALVDRFGDTVDFRIHFTVGVDDVPDEIQDEVQRISEQVLTEGKWLEGLSAKDEETER